MKKKIFALFITLGALGFVYSPAPAKTPVENNRYGFIKTAAASTNKQVRYIRHRGRLYRVRYYRRPRYRYVRYYRPRKRYIRYYRPRRRHVRYYRY